MWDIQKWNTSKVEIQISNHALKLCFYDIYSGSTGTNGLVMEDEMQLDGSIVSASFDNSLELGVAGTSSGTLWYINWDERSSIRLVSGHVQQVCQQGC